jgi:hypothetical protein
MFVLYLVSKRHIDFVCSFAWIHVYEYTYTLTQNTYDLSCNYTTLKKIIFKVKTAFLDLQTNCSPQWDNLVASLGLR